jgi:hypothetical protein
MPPNIESFESKTSVLKLSLIINFHKMKLFDPVVYLQELVNEKFQAEMKNRLKVINV